MTDWVRLGDAWVFAGQVIAIEDHGVVGELPAIRLTLVNGCTVHPVGSTVYEAAKALGITNG